MQTAQFARAAGAVYLGLGAASFVPALSTRPRALPRMKLDKSYGLFLGLFPQNVINKVAILAFGAAGRPRRRSDGRAGSHARCSA